MSDFPDLSLRYADHTDGILDLHLPVGPSRGALFLVHGGFWRTAYDRTHTRPMATALAADGWLVLTPEYARVGPGGRGGWPFALDDVWNALAAAPRLLEPHGVTIDEVSVMGHSAGGHLALCVAAGVRAPQGIPRIRAAVPLAPVGDLALAAERHLGADAVLDFLAGTDRAAADPMLLLHGATAPVTIVHGVEDDIVPVELSRAVVARHPDVRLREVPGGHFEPITPGTAAWGRVRELLESS